MNLEQILKQATESADLHGAEYTVSRDEHYRWSTPKHQLVLGERKLDLDLPAEGDSASLAEGLTIEVRTYGEGLEWLRSMLPLYHAAESVMAEFNAAIQDTIAEAKAKELDDQVQRERELAEREARLEERKQRLLNEFMEEDGRIRLSGYKRLRPVTVHVQEYGEDTGDYRPYFEYKYKDKHGWHKEWMSHKVVAFHVKVGKRYLSVWDNGQEDLSEWERKPALNAPPSYDGRKEDL